MSIISDLNNNSLREVVQFNLISKFPTSAKLNLLCNERISCQENFMFIHIPKTGGTSINKALEKHAIAAQKKYYRTQFIKHAKAKDIKKILGDKVYAKYFSFAFVRNPWDLMVSSYHWWRQKAEAVNRVSGLYRGFGEPDINKIKSMSFDDFITSKYGRGYINEHKGEIFDWISEDGEIIIDYVGKLETLQEDWQYICSKTGLPFINLSHSNYTKREHYRTYYSEHTRELVAARFRRTIEQFEYEF